MSSERPAGAPGATVSVLIALVYPELLGTYGDGGNATVLAQRLRWRGHERRVSSSASAAETVPASCDLYVIGGGEDLPQGLAAAKLNASRPLHRAVDSGAAVLAVCAGLQIMGESFVGPDGQAGEGLGLLDCVTVRVRVAPGDRRGARRALRRSGRATAWACSPASRTTGPSPSSVPAPGPLGEVRLGIGNKDGTVEGAVAGRVWATYLHGPVLARNPRLADLLLSWVVGPLGPLDDSEPDALHAERVTSGAVERRFGAPGRRRRRPARRRPQGRAGRSGRTEEGTGDGLPAPPRSSPTATS